MLDWLLELDFMPHGHCYLWRPDILWTHVISDGLIALAYFSIPVSLVYVIRKRRDVPFRNVLLLFAAFIIMCGITHIFAIVTIWQPVYMLEGVMKAATALISILTAIALVPLLPKALAMRSPAELEAANARLNDEVEKRAEAEQKMAQALKTLQASNQDLEHFAYATSHDLQSPLRSMVSYSQLLQRQLKNNQDPRTEEYLRSIGESGEHMQAQIAGLLQIARINFDQAAHVLTAMDKALVLAKQLLKGDIEESRAVIQAGSLPAVLANEAQMVQLLQNLIGNSIKYVAPGVQPQITLRAAEEGAHWHFIVADNGIGIPEKDLNDLFVMFKRAQNGADYAGTGLGLAVCKRIVERHGGRLWAESALGAGAQFHFTLPT